MLKKEENVKLEGKDELRDNRLYNSSFAQACENAVNGIIYSAATQTNIRKQLIIGVIAMILSLFYDYSVSEFLCLTFAVFFVIFAEMQNTAIETIVDLITEKYHPKAKIAKDVGAGAVVLAAVNAVIVAYFLFFRKTDVAQMGTSIFSTMIASPMHLAFVGIILTTIAVLGIKTIVAIKQRKNGNVPFIPSGQSAIAFAILTAIWITANDPITFCLGLVLSLMVVGNRLYSARKFSEVLFGAFMGTLIVMMIYGLIVWGR